MKVSALSEAPHLLDAFASLGRLPPSIAKAFVTMPTPFPKDFWVATDDAQGVVARIGASVSPVRPGEGAIGFFEYDVSRGDEAARALLLKAEAWLKSKGVTKVHGPMNFNTWFPYRFRVGDSKERFSWEPEHPPEYLSVWEKAGYGVLESYHSQGHEDLAGYAERMKSSYDKATSYGFTFRQFDSSKVMDQEVPILYDISMEGFRDALLFEQIPFQAFRALYVPIAGKLDLSLSFIASHVDHGPVGFFFAFQDKDYVVFKTIAVKVAARGKGVSNAMMYLSAKLAHERGLRKLITAMVKSGAQSESYGKHAKLLWENHYVLLTKHL